MIPYLKREREREAGRWREKGRLAGKEGGWKNWTGNEGNGKKERKEKSLTESAISTHEKSYLNT